METVTAIYVGTNGEVKTIELENGYKSFNRTIGAEIGTVVYCLSIPDVFAWVDDEGLFTKQFNETLTRIVNRGPLYGNGILCQGNNDGETISLFVENINTILHNSVCV